MSLPTFPKDTGLTRDDAINQILSSIAMEELGLSHIINAEGEKMQYILGTLPGVNSHNPGVTIDQLLQANESVREFLETVSYNQLFLKRKMRDILDFAEKYYIYEAASVPSPPIDNTDPESLAQNTNPSAGTEATDTEEPH